MNAGGQKEEVPVRSSDVSINGVGVGILDDFPAVRIWFRFHSQGLGNDGARLHHDSAGFYGGRQSSLPLMSKIRLP